MKPKTYTIRTIDDMTNIPESRLDKFMNEFVVSLKTAIRIKEIGISNRWDSIEWCDDGQWKSTVTISPKGKHAKEKK